MLIYHPLSSLTSQECVYHRGKGIDVSLDMHRSGAWAACRAACLPPCGCCCDCLSCFSSLPTPPPSPAPRAAVHNNLLSNIDVGEGTRPFASSGSAPRGAHAGASPAWCSCLMRRGAQPPPNRRRSTAAVCPLSTPAHAAAASNNTYWNIWSSARTKLFLPDCDFGPDLNFIGESGGPLRGLLRWIGLSWHDRCRPAAPGGSQRCRQPPDLPCAIHALALQAAPTARPTTARTTSRASTPPRPTPATTLRHALLPCRVAATVIPAGWLAKLPVARPPLQPPSTRRLPTVTLLRPSPSAVVPPAERLVCGAAADGQDAAAGGHLCGAGGQAPAAATPVAERRTLAPVSSAPPRFKLSILSLRYLPACAPSLPDSSC